MMFPQSIVMWIVDTWWRHQMETFSALLAICTQNSPVPGEFPAQRLVARSFDIFFELCLNKRLSKQSWGWWFETPSRPLWRHCNDPHSFSPAMGILGTYSEQWYLPGTLVQRLSRSPPDALPGPHRHPVRRASWDHWLRTRNSYHRGRRGSRARDWN